MKKLIAKFFIALVVLGGISGSSFAKTILAAESVNKNNSAFYSAFRLLSRSKNTHRIFLNRGYNRISISGDGDTDLDLYVYGGNGLADKSESYGDDETVVINASSSGYFFIEVVNHGKVYNDYKLIVY
jgi:hypothetical protein